MISVTNIPGIFADYTKRVAVITMCGLFSACANYSELKDPEYEPTIADFPPPKTEADGGLFHAGTNAYLFEDIKATRVGDLVTILLSEETNASKSASIAADKNTNIDFPNPTIFGKSDYTYDGHQVLQSSAEANRDIDGSGDVEQENSLNGSITVTVTEVLPNGYLVVKGEKLLTLNEGSEVVRIAGLVRPTDISSNNTIESTKVANAHITYKGNGAVSDSGKAGWLFRFFTSAIWPL